MKLEQFQSMVRIEYTAGEEATAVVRLPVLAASDVLLTGGLNVYWACPVLALPEPLKYIYKGMPEKVNPKPTGQPANPAGEVQPDPKAAVTAEDDTGRRTRNNFGWTGIAKVLFEHIVAARKKQGLPALTPAAVETIQPMGVVEVDLVALLKSMQFPSGTYCFRRATPMDKLLVQPAPNRVLKQEHLNLLYHQLLYIQQELCEVKFIRAEVVRDGTYNGGVLEDPKVTPDPDPEKPNPVKPTPDTDTPKPVPKPSVDDDTKPIPSSAELVAQGYEIAYVQDGVPLIFGLQPFRMNKKQQQIDKNGYRTVNNIVSDLLVSDPRKAFTTYADAVGIKPTAAMLEAKNYRKNSYGEYIGEKPRYQTTVLPSNNPFGRYTEVSKDANGYAINLRKDRDTGTYQWFVNLAPSSTESNGSTETQPTTPSSGTGSAVTPTEPAPEHREEHREEPAPARPEPEPAPERHDPTPTAPNESSPTVSSDPEDHGAVVKEYHVASAPTANYHKEDHVPTYLGYSRDAYGNYPALGTITKWVVAKDSPESVRSTPPMYLDEHNSIVEWTVKEDTGEGYWTLKLDDEPTSSDARASEAPAPANEDRGATIKEVHSFSDLPRYKRRNNGDNMRAYGYTEDSHYNYPAIPPIIKYVAADDASEDVRGVLPLVLDKNGSVLQWAIETNRELPDQPTVAYWAVEYDGDRFS